MDRQKVFLDIEAVKRDRIVEKHSKNHILAVVLILCSALGISTVMALVFPGTFTAIAKSPAQLFQDALNTQNKILTVAQHLSSASVDMTISAQLSDIFSKPAPIVVASADVPKPATATKSIAVETKTVTKQDQPTEVKSTTQTKSQPTTEKTTQPKQVKQSTIQKPKASPKPAAKPVAKTTPKKEKKQILDQVDIAIPIPSMGSRPADANYGVPENWPMDSPVSAPYGYLPERGRFHAGVDLEAPLGTPIEAAGAGKVIRADWFAGYGMCVDIEHANGYVTRYGHFSAIWVKVGDWVSATDWIGACGSTGNSSCPHLHFEVYHNGSSMDPEKINWTMRRMPPKAY